jgi:hypothetical protein
MPAFVYNAESSLGDFNLEAALGEGIAIYIYGAVWQGSMWLSDPTAALVAVNDALNTVTDLSYSGVQIFSSLSSQGTGMAFATANTLYKNNAYLDPSDIAPLRAAIRIALNTVSNLIYGDIVLGASKSGV